MGEWLTDYNCDHGDAGGLPGYPLSPTRSDGTAIDGYCTDGVQTSESACIAQYFCTVAGSCDAPATAAAVGECGVCSTTSGQPTATDRFTQTECVKDSDGDGTSDGTWAAATWSTSAATEADCASVLGGSGRPELGCLPRWVMRPQAGFRSRQRLRRLSLLLVSLHRQRLSRPQTSLQASQRLSLLATGSRSVQLAATRVQPIPARLWDIPYCRNQLQRRGLRRVVHW